MNIRTKISELSFSSGLTLSKNSPHRSGSIVTQISIQASVSMCINFNFHPIETKQMTDKI